MNYLCKYAPVELLQSFGFEVAYKNPSLPLLDEESSRLHRNICGFCRALEQTYREDQGDDREPLLLTNCCNSMEALRITLEQDGVSTYLIDLPYQQDACSVDFYTDQLKALVQRLESDLGQSFDPQAFRQAFPAQEPAQKEPYIALVGSRLPDALKDSIEALSLLPLVNLTCTGDRNLSQPPATEDGDQLMAWYAHALLSQRSCMRMAQNDDHRQLLNDPFLRGIVFTTVSFCDFYSFEYGALAKASDLPMVLLQTDYTDQSVQQIKTRLEAFFETLNAQERKARQAMTHPSTRPTAQTQAYYAGIDSGSTSTNCVILQGDHIVASSSLPTGIDVQSSADAVLKKCLEAAQLDRQQIQALVTTGYGRDRIQGKSGDITEISCHAAGAHFLNPQVRTVIDIGGQDSKVIHLDSEGHVSNFAMNDKCAAGTGRFLEMMAMALGLSLEEMSQLGEKHTKNIKISSMCSVFAQSEVVSLIADGHKVEDIVHGLNVSVTNKVLALGGSKMEGAYMMTGGVARNAGVRQTIEEKLGEKLFVFDEPDICGALGAALLAQQNAN